MNSQDLRSKITAAIEHEERTGTVAGALSRHLDDNGVSWTPAQQQQCLDFVKAYVLETPEIIDVAYRAAKQLGVLDELRPVFEACFEYWAEQGDCVPDQLGLIGLADDAYLTRMLMEAVSGLHCTRTGRPLLSIDLGPPNRMMRSLIGEPAASTLDGAVGRTVARQMLRAGLQQLGGFGGLKLHMPEYASYMSRYRIDRTADVRLGTIGVVDDDK